MAAPRFTCAPAHRRSSSSHKHAFLHLHFFIPQVLFRLNGRRRHQRPWRSCRSDSGVRQWRGRGGTKRHPRPARHPGDDRNNGSKAQRNRRTLPHQAREESRAGMPGGKLFPWHPSLAAKASLKEPLPPLNCPLDRHGALSPPHPFLFLLGAFHRTLQTAAGFKARLWSCMSTQR